MQGHDYSHQCSKQLNQWLQNYKGNDAATGPWDFRLLLITVVTVTCILQENSTAVWVLPPPVWAKQNMTGMTILYIPLTVNRVLFYFSIEWGQNEPFSQNCFRDCHDGIFNWTAPHCTQEHWNGKSDQHVFKIYWVSAVFLGDEFFSFTGAPFDHSGGKR